MPPDSLREKKILSLIYGSAGPICRYELPHQALKDAPEDRNGDRWSGLQMVASLSVSLSWPLLSLIAARLTLSPRYGAISQGDQSTLDGSRLIPLDSFSFEGGRNLSSCSYHLLWRCVCLPCSECLHQYQPLRENSV